MKLHRGRLLSCRAERIEPLGPTVCLLIPTKLTFALAVSSAPGCAVFRAALAAGEHFTSMAPLHSLGALVYDFWHPQVTMTLGSTFKPKSHWITHACASLRSVRRLRVAPRGLTRPDAGDVGLYRHQSRSVFLESLYRHIQKAFHLWRYDGSNGVTLRCWSNRNGPGSTIFFSRQG